MDQGSNQLLFALFRSAICGGFLSEKERALFSDAVLSDMGATAKKHDLTHLLAVGLNKNKLLLKGNNDIENEIIKAVYRYEQLNYELGKLCEALETVGIDFMPLKGSVIRKYYPEPWMRTSCDIDILVHNEDLENAAQYIIENRGYVLDGKGSHDISLMLDDIIHLELHYTLIGEGVARSSCIVLNNVWSSTFLREGKQYCYEMTDEMFYFYHIAHMAKHFEEGGCGIRPFIDLWILDNIEGADKSKRDELLKQGELLRFAEMARALSRVWFDNEDHTEITKQIEDYVLRGGVYGTIENNIMIQQQKKGGRLRYALSKIFIPYDIIKFHYPILQKHRWLTPIMEVRRWFKLIFCGHASKSVKELKYNSNISRAEAENVQAFLKNIGLQ